MYVLLMAAAGLLLVFGKRRMSASIAMLLLGGIFLPILSEPLFDAMPSWVVTLVMLIGVIGMVGQVSSQVSAGRERGSGGIIIASFAMKLVLLPFRILAWLACLLFRRYNH
jgi:hypothetical protein